MTERYLEDYAVGQKFGSGRIRVEKEQIKAFAAEFDLHTAAVTMRLLVGGELKPAGGIVGAGLEEFRWPRPASATSSISNARARQCGRQR